MASVLSGVSEVDVGVFSATGRFTTFVTGAAVLLVVTGAFFTVFDLNTALGSSLRLPIVHIGQEESLPDDAQELALGEDESLADAAAGMTGASAAVSSPAAPSSSWAASEEGAGQTITQSDGSGRQYIEEEVQVNGRRPDPKTEHPGRGVGLTKKSKP